VKRCDGERCRENEMFVLIYARREHGRHACIKDMQVPFRIYRGVGQWRITVLSFAVELSS
jgi:hypothetical protein